MNNEYDGREKLGLPACNSVGHGQTSGGRSCRIARSQASRWRACIGHVASRLAWHDWESHLSPFHNLSFCELILGRAEVWRTSRSSSRRPAA